MYSDQTILATFCKGRTVAGLGPDGGRQRRLQSRAGVSSKRTEGCQWAKVGTKTVSLASLSLRRKKERLKRPERERRDCGPRPTRGGS